MPGFGEGKLPGPPAQFDGIVFKQFQKAAGALREIEPFLLAPVRRKSGLPLCVDRRHIHIGIWVDRLPVRGLVAARHAVVEGYRGERGGFGRFAFVERHAAGKSA